MRSLIYSLEKVGFTFPGSLSSFALDIESLDIHPGEIVALVGPNGAGKTTLLMLLALLARPNRGRLEFLGNDPWRDDTGILRARRQVVLVAHHPYLFKGTVAENVAFGLKLRRVAEAERSALVDSALSFVELDGWGTKPISSLSAGQLQRVALARALALRPQALLLDEPTANIDAAVGMRLEAALREVSRQWGAAVVFSTHNPSQASCLADNILYLSSGRRVEFSQENCFSGIALSDGGTSWIEPRPGFRLFFAGTARGHVTCIVDPGTIRLSRADAAAPPNPKPNAYRGCITRMETTSDGTALIWVAGDLNLRVALPLAAVQAQGLSLSGEVVLEFDPGKVKVTQSIPEAG